MKRLAALLALVALAFPAAASAHTPTVDGPDLQCNPRLDYVDIDCYPVRGTVLCGMDVVLIGPDVAEYRFRCREWPW